MQANSYAILKQFHRNLMIVFYDDSDLESTGGCIPPE